MTQDPLDAIVRARHTRDIYLNNLTKSLANRIFRRNEPIGARSNRPLPTA